LGDVLKNTVPLDILTIGDFRCVYCGRNSHSSMGKSPPHACPVCWVAIQKV
jgi:rubrerythrin